MLARPKFARWAADGRGTIYVAGIKAGSEEHHDPPEPPTIVRDPDDDYLVALARSAEADAIVSLDRDLLDAEVVDLPVLDPARFLRDLIPAGDGLVLSRYRLLERLGAGGFGVVWRAHDELLQREVAVKRIWLGPDGDADRAMREAHAIARLSHPAIVALYEACPVGDALYMICELVHGQTLGRLIADGLIEDRQILAIGVALTEALEHTHARGVFHRDIKPQNVLVPDRPRATGSREHLAAAKLTDFGGASIAEEDALTRTGDVLGTLAYMAPEQIEGHEVGEEADLYSLALVLYEALCGENPVRGATPAATARRIGSRLEPLAGRRRDLPPKLSQAIDRAVSPRPSDRGSLKELRFSLDDARKPGRRSRRGRIRQRFRGGGKPSA